jgi:adenylate cyclase
MAVEIERKFLVINDSWKEKATRKFYCQGYLSRDKGRTVRVRRVDDTAFLTVKGTTTKGCSRSEYEYEIPVNDGQELLDILCHQPLIKKYRYLVEFAGMVWEVDEFLEKNSPLVVAEIELEYIEQPFEKPPWLGAEVTGDIRYYNSSLSQKSYSDWK